MPILLVEIEEKGHHISTYTRSIVAGLLKKKKKIIFLTSKNIKKIQFYSYLKKNTKIIYIKPLNYPIIRSQLNYLKFQFNNYKLIKDVFKKIYKKEKIDYVYLNTLDFFDKPLSIYGSPFEKINFSALYLNPKFYKSFNILSLNYIKKIINEILFFKLMKIKTLKNLFIIDPLFFNYIKKKKILYKNKLTLLKEIGTANQITKFSFSKLKCREILNIDKNKFVILVYGSIRENKSLIELVRVVNAFKQKSKLKILIAGLIDDETKNFLKINVYKNDLINSNFTILDQYIDDKLEKIVFKASDITWLGYSKKFYGSSGVLFLSSQNKVPVIGSDHGLLAWYLKKFNVGFSINLTNTKRLTNLIEKLIKNKSNIKFNFKKINKKRNFLNFSEKIISKIF